MNIVFVIHDLKGNGAERVVLNLARLFVAQKQKCQLWFLRIKLISKSLRVLLYSVIRKALCDRFHVHYEAGSFPLF